MQRSIFTLVELIVSTKVPCEIAITYSWPHQPPTAELFRIILVTTVLHFPSRVRFSVNLGHGRKWKLNWMEERMRTTNTFPVQTEFQKKTCSLKNWQGQIDIFWQRSYSSQTLPINIFPYLIDCGVTMASFSVIRTFRRPRSRTGWNNDHSRWRQRLLPNKQNLQGSGRGVKVEE